MPIFIFVFMFFVHVIINIWNITGENDTLITQFPKLNINHSCHLNFLHLPIFSNNKQDINPSIPLNNTKSITISLNIINILLYLIHTLCHIKEEKSRGKIMYDYNFESFAIHLILFHIQSSLNVFLSIKFSLVCLQKFTWTSHL